MAASKSKTYTITGSGASYVFVLDNDLKIKGIYQDGKVLDPTNPQWSVVAEADETKTLWNQFKATSGLPTEISPSEITQAFYLSEYNKELNTTTDAKSIESSNNLFYSTGVVADTRKVGDPTQFASPSAVNYGARGKASIAGAPSVLSYPIDIDIDPTTGQDYLSITKYTYDRGGNVNLSGPGADNFTNQVVGDGAGKYGGTVILPMPKVSDANGAEWGDSDLNVFGIAAAGAFSQSIKSVQDATTGQLLSGITQDFSKMGQFLSANASGGAGIMGSVIASKALTTIGITISPDELLARSTGKIANPNAELLFQGPILRDFAFSFLMIARSSAEGKEIRKIIKWFKQGAAPKYQNVALLGTPDIFKLEYSSDKLNRFRQMALRTITVDYAPDGYWAAYDDSQPIALVMNLQFTELKPVYDVDQNEAGDNVGY